MLAAMQRFDAGEMPDVSVSTGNAGTQTATAEMGTQASNEDGM